jgi:hypothetical protein
LELRSCGDCVSAYLPATDIYGAQARQPNQPNSTSSYWRRTGTSFSAPLAAAIALRWIETRRALGYAPGYAEVYDYLLNQSYKTVNGTPTPERWACFGNTPNVGDQWYPFNPGTCDPGTVGPYYFAPTTNTSDARIILGNVSGGSGNCFP